MSRYAGAAWIRRPVETTYGPEIARSCTKCGLTLCEDHRFPQHVRERTWEIVMRVHACQPRRRFFFLDLPGFRWVAKAFGLA